MYFDKFYMVINIFNNIKILHTIIQDILFNMKDENLKH
jgi:hypothetical protein